MCRFNRLLFFASLCWFFEQGLSQVRGCEGDVIRHDKDTLDGWHSRNAVTFRDNQTECEKADVYICEELPNAIPLDDERFCNIRNVNYHEQIYRWVSGHQCLFYTPGFHFLGGVNSLIMTASCLYEQRFAPCLEIAKEDGTCGCYPFDPGFEEVKRVVENALIPSSRDRFQRCFHEAKECCDEYLAEEPVTSNETRCGTTFDAWTCWRGAPADTIAYEVCSDFAYSNSGPTCHHFSSKECYENGTWERNTDYSTCSISPRLIRRYHFHISILAFSIVSCLPAVFIFFYYKRLRITRVILHRNLLIAIVIRNILVIISRSVIYIDELRNAEDTVMSNHSVACRMLSILERVAANAVFVCMLIEGIYLHRLIVAVFKNKININLLYVIGTVVTIVPVVAWATVMGIHNDHSCWVIYTVDNIQWILDSPRIAILVINTILFADVLRVLLTKVRNSENANQLNTAKASLFLMPIFGIQFLLTAFRPSTTNCTGEQAYYYIAYTVEGLQGFIVALLYCYINKEVHMLVKATYKKKKLAIKSRVRGNSTYPRMSTNINSDRRHTFSTGLASQHVDDNDKNDYATIRPNLHVAEIISIQGTEKLGETLEPVYEIIDKDVPNEDCSFVRSVDESTSKHIPNKESKDDNYYGFTNASSVSIECPDWIQSASSPNNSIYNNSQNDYEKKYIDNINPKQPTVPEMGLRKRNPTQDILVETMAENNSPIIKFENKVADINAKEFVDNDQEYKNKLDELQKGNVDDNNASDGIVSDDMLDEIINYIDNNDPIKLNPDLLSPNRKEEDKIRFIDE
ncbi:uncharacterized protein LOC131841737 [Achroia grisella]|uniref:uncharacterized protein LOC131841737 n=1 Tax=Achroia grisella TaxID=688607 RepID=UPI0027D29C7F|nr:uncharacterized protein LOC131841737 [Achroia grisella]